MQGYTIKKLNPANPNNPRGGRTWEWRLNDGKQISAMRRLKNEDFGNHFHKGEDPSKNPELILFLAGVTEVEFLDKNGKYSKEKIDANKEPIELIIEPWTLHRFVGKTDVFYIEPRLSYFDPASPDTYPAEEFPHRFPEK